MLVRIGMVGTDGATRPHPRYGGQIQDHAIPGATPEAAVRLRDVDVDLRLDDGTVVTLVRPEVAVSELAAGPLGPGVGTMALVAPAIHGSGLLESVPVATLAAMADEDDRDGDGISGRLNLVRTTAGRAELPGRFGWKAGQPDVAHQVAAALARDIGITSSMRPGSPTEQPEIDDDDLAALVFYVRLLGVPARRGVDGPRVLRGETLFARVGCAACHRPELRTADDADPPALAGQSIRPYTDLLLHDMGPGLASAIGEGGAGPREWRTPPLWGLGLIRTVNGHTRLLHDGRARGPVEAILWHDGEAAAARREFVALPADDRRALIAFLDSL